MSDIINTTELFRSLESEVHVWYCRPQSGQSAGGLSADESVLSASEIERYQRFYFDKDKHNYLAAHAMLRHVLSKYINIAASEWRFSSNSHGKPLLIQQAGLADLTFNLSHTDGLCACVIALNRHCGIDTEYIHRKNDVLAVAKRMFAEQELANMQADEQSLFYYYWTLREAYVKALGTGLAGSSKDFYFALDANKSGARLRHKNKRDTEAARWRFDIFRPTDEHVMTVAYESKAGVQFKIAEFDLAENALHPLGYYRRVNKHAE